ncbi:hypothetical protein HNP84_008315 [Thermocatellispora tengchongensis]|uniref:Uncharacterized protein n=1 Tax=Thermocatellispora tengchongensis TaxID=1073253 RepID=A0A840PL89_9ACTN|nr:hypothetical protein [Thermocatellispora tengchongensis]MBB5138561.1 hypothetical protein [Thermocatellispora tengchongensis]
MPEHGFTLTQLAALLVLMAEAREIPNTELREVYGIDLSGKNRIALNDMKLVETRRVGRRNVHVLTDGGWARMTDEIRAGVQTPRGGAMGGVVRALLAAIDRDLDRTGRRPAEFFYTPPQVDLEDAIRAAYADLAREPGGWVSLTDLRPRVPAEKAQVDEALRRMVYSPEVSIIPESNQKILTRADREAAVTIGDQELHLIAIEAR